MYSPPQLRGTGIPLAPASSEHRILVADGTGGENKFLRTLRRRAKLFVSVVVAIIAVVTIYTLSSPKRYTTEVKVIAGNPSGVAQNPQLAQTGLPVLNALLVGNAAQSAATYVELMGQTPVFQRVIDDLHLNTNVSALKSAVRVRQVPTTNILTIQVAWSDPETSATIANKFAAVFAAREGELVASQANGALEFLSHQLPQARRRLATAEQNVSRYESANNIADLPTQTTSTVNAAVAVDQKINQVQLDKRQADAQIASLSSTLAGMTALTGGGTNRAQNPVLPTLNQKLADLTVQLGTAREQFTDSYPAVIALRQQIADVKREIARQPAMLVQNTSTIANPVHQQLTQQLSAARAMSDAASAQLAQLAQQRSAINPQLASLPARAQHLAELKREQAIAESTYNALQQKYNDATISRSTGISDVTITQPAVASLAATTPHVFSNILTGALFAILFGLGLVFLVDRFDGRIRDERDVQDDLHLPVLASIPRLPPGGSSAAIPARLRNAVMESYFQLVVAMRYSSDQPLRCITITSPLQGDGKSTIAMNVAGAVAEIAVAGRGRPKGVLIIDADMRRPSLHKKFGLKNELGLSDILVGRTSLREAVQQSDKPGVEVLTSGTPSPNPIKLLQSDRFDELLREARDMFVTVIIDAPALVPVYDAAIISAKTDGTVMIVSAAQTNVRATRQAMARLESVGVHDLIGVVVNRSTAQGDYGDYFATPPSRELVEVPATTTQQTALDSLT